MRIHLGEMRWIFNRMPFKGWEDAVALGFPRSILTCTVFYGTFVSVLPGVGD